MDIQIEGYSSQKLGELFEIKLQLHFAVVVFEAEITLKQDFSFNFQIRRIYNSQVRLKLANLKFEKGISVALKFTSPQLKLDSFFVCHSLGLYFAH